MNDYHRLGRMDSDEAIEQMYRVPGGMEAMVSFVTAYTDARYGTGALRQYLKGRKVLPKSIIIPRLEDMMTEEAPDKKATADTLYRIQNDPNEYYDIEQGYIDCDNFPIHETDLEEAIMTLADR